MSFKIAIIGAGSVGFTKKMFTDILCVPEFRDIEFALTDLSEHNLQMIKAITLSGSKAAGCSCGSTRSVGRAG